MNKKEMAGADHFRIKAYGRTELALLYNDRVAPETAWRKLRSWIRKFPGLLEKLTALGYHRNQRSFTPAEVRAIVDALGEP